MVTKGELSYFSRITPTEIPDRWHKARLSSVCSFQNGETLESEDRRDGQIPVFGSNGQIDLHDRANTNSPAIIVGRKGSAGAVNYSEQPVFAIDTAYFVDSQSARCELRWLYYLLISLNLEGESEHSAVPGINSTFIKEHIVPIPDLEEQEKIAAFLDFQISSIDEIIEKQHRLLDLLNERDESFTTQVMTVGLDEQAIKKDSGIPTIGEVPAHWEIVPNRAIFQEVDNRSDDGSEDLLSVSHKSGVTLREEKDVNMFEADSLEGYKIAEEGDFVINTMWAWMGAVGIAPQTGLVSPSYHVYRPNESVISEFVDYFYRTPPYVTEMGRYSKGVWKSRSRLYPDEFLRMKTICPPKQEQKKIVNALKNEENKISELSTKLEESIDLFEEKRQALITGVVTGKIDVRDWDQTKKKEVTA